MGDKLNSNFRGYVKALILLNFHFNSFVAHIAVIKLAFEEVRILNRVNPILPMEVL